MIAYAGGFIQTICYECHQPIVLSDAQYNLQGHRICGKCVVPVKTTNCCRRPYKLPRS
jgi:hypothetical protein